MKIINPKEEKTFLEVSNEDYQKRYWESLLKREVYNEENLTLNK